MNISVYFYDEEGRYTHMDMAPLEFDSEGVQILPEKSTNIYPPDLSTDPRFSVELGKWVPQKAVPPYSSEDYKAEVSAIRDEMQKALKDVRIETERLREGIKRLGYYNSVESIRLKSIYDQIAQGNF